MTSIISNSSHKTSNNLAYATTTTRKAKSPLDNSTTPIGGGANPAAASK